MRILKFALCCVAFLTILKQQEVSERLEAQQAKVVNSSPQAFGKFVTGEIAQWKAVAKAGGIKAE